MTTEAQFRRAFQRGVSQTTDAVRIGQLRAALAAGNTEEVVRLIDIEPAAFDELRGLMVQQMAETGSTEVADMTFRPPVRWNSANPRVEQYARTQVGTRITNVTNEMVDAVRWSVGDGYAFGRSPDRMALDLVGRVGPSGKREGGIVGLNLQQTQWVANMRKAMESDDPSSALRYTKRDRRFDKLLKSGKPLTSAQIDNASRQYANKLLLSRGRTIAVTERGLAINAGRYEAWRQAADKMGFSLRDLLKTWIHTGRAIEDRLDHIAVNGQTVRGLDTPFIVAGIPMQHPHDPQAPASQVVNCRCEFKVRLANV